MEEEKKEHEEHHEHHRKHDLTDKIRKNPWMLSTLVCGALVLILLVSTFFGGFTGQSISANAAGQKLVSFYESMGVSNITVNSVKEVSGVYQVNINYQGQTIPLYITKDGKNVITSLNPTETEETNTNTNTEVQKSDKPSVELYVFTYCPYGTQMEKAVIPAVKLLGDSINFKIRQIGAMHGEHEKLEAERQLCIEKLYPTKFLDYVLKFAENSAIGTCNGDTACLTPQLVNIYGPLGIDAAKINTCIANEGETMYNAEVSNAESKGVSGSPTMIINGATVQSERNPEAVKGTICSAFNNAPSTCSTALSTTASSAGFGSGSGSSTSASC
jgi:protein-disulfide isomerase